MRKVLIMLLVILVTTDISIARDTLMPAPKKIEYGKSMVQVKGVTIGFASTPSSEDRFTARELAKILEEASGDPVSITESTGMPAFIILERSGDPDPLPVPKEETGQDSRESYRIKISKEGIHLSSPSSAGLFYAVQTMRQMIEEKGGEAFLPEAAVEDWPSMAYRGFMMDMSHTQLPKIEEIKRQLDFLAMWKANQYFFYSEASIELEGYPLLMADARFTRDQVREIINYGRERYIDVIPHMELYGHLHDLFRLEHYSDMAVIPHGGEFRPDDPGVVKILEDWIEQISHLFPSPFFHIGYDETWLIKKEAEKLGAAPEELYIKMLKQTIGLVEQHGKTSLYYADMLQKFPSIIPDVPENTIAIAWHYFPKEEAKYEPLMKPFQKEGIEMFVQSATINWFSVVPQFSTSFINTNLLLKMGRKYGATGFINSGWTDDTQTMMRQSFPDLALGSVAAWQEKPVDMENFFENYANILYPGKVAERIGQALTSMMVSEKLISDAVGRTDIALFDNPFTAKRLKQIDENKKKLQKGRLEAEKAQMDIMEAMKYGLDISTLETMYYGAKALDYVALKYLYTAEINNFWNEMTKDPDNNELRSWFRMEISFKYHTRTSDMLDAISVLKGLFKKAWLNEYETFRLEIGLGKYDLELQNWLNLQKNMEGRVWDFSEENPLPALEGYF